MFIIKAIVSLPRNVFIDTPTLTSLFFARKKTGDEILSWDKEWNKYEEDARAKVKKAKSILPVKKRKKFTDKIEIQSMILNILDPMIKKNDWSLKKGRNSELLTFTLPPYIKDIDEAANYYKALLSTASIERYIDRYVFQNMLNKFDYSYDAFIVDEVGFKLSKRKEKARPNQLIAFQGVKSGKTIRNLHLCEEDQTVVINRKRPKTIIDYIRSSVEW